MMKALLGAATLALGLGLGAPTMACELDRPLKMAGLDYDSAAFHTALAGAIAERGFGCKVERVPGVIAPLVNGLARGDVDIVMEIWMANPVDAWVKAAEAGKVEPLGTTFPDASEGWFVPRYVVSGSDAKAPDLKSVKSNVNRLRKHTKLPICVGFGVKTAEQARIIGASADGVVVGTAIVNAVANVLGSKGEMTADPAEAVATLVSGLSQGVRAARLAPVA